MSGAAAPPAPERFTVGMLSADFSPAAARARSILGKLL